MSATLREAAEAAISMLEHVSHWKPSMAAHVQQVLKAGIEADKIMPSPVTINLAALLNVLDRVEDRSDECSYCEGFEGHKQGCPLEAFLAHLRAIPAAPCQCGGEMLYDPEAPADAPRAWCICGEPKTMDVASKEAL